MLDMDLIWCFLKCEIHLKNYRLAKVQVKKSIISFKFLIWSKKSEERVTKYNI